MLEEAWRPRAELDLQSITIFLAVECHNQKAASAVRTRLYSAIETLREFPDMGGTVSPDGLDRTYRTMPVNPYIIYYTFTDDRLTIHRILHQRQDTDVYALVDL